MFGSAVLGASSGRVGQVDVADVSHDDIEPVGRQLGGYDRPMPPGLVSRSARAAALAGGSPVAGPRKPSGLTMRVCPGQARVRIRNCRKGRYQERKEEPNVNLRIFRRVPARKRGLLAMLAAAVAASTSLAVAAGAGTAASAAPAAPARADQVPAEATGLGQLSGICPRAS